MPARPSMSIMCLSLPPVLSAWQYVVMVTILCIYLLCQYFVEVPGCPRGYIGPGGLAAPVGQEHCTGGAHRHIDYKIFGPWVLWLLLLCVQPAHPRSVVFRVGADDRLSLRVCLIVGLRVGGCRWHIYHGVSNGVPTSSATCSDTYQCAVYDPEGTLGSLTAAGD